MASSPHPGTSRRHKPTSGAASRASDRDNVLCLSLGGYSCSYGPPFVFTLHLWRLHWFLDVKIDACNFRSSSLFIKNSLHVLSIILRTKRDDLLAWARNRTARFECQVAGNTRQDLASGLYFYRVNVPSFAESRKRVCKN
jgi:hypothetical protein